MCFYFLRLKTSPTVKFKRRITPYITKSKLTFGDVGLFTVKQFRFEPVYFRFLKKTLRKRYRKRKMLFSSQRYWVRFNRNTALSKKAKNARMGSGKGKFLRFVFTVSINKPFLEARGFSPRFLVSVGQRFIKKIPVSLRLTTKSYRSLFLN